MEGLKLRRDANGLPIVAEPSLSEWLNASHENIRRELDKLAYHAHLDQPSLVGTADIRQGDVFAALMAASKAQPDTKFVRLEEYLRDRAGLLTSRGDGLYQFPHRSFQEYLAACHLARFDFPDTLSRLVKTDPNRWREVTLLAAARSKGAPSSIWELVEELCAKDEAPAEDAREPSNEVQWGALLAGQVLRETGLAAHDPNLQERHERKRRRVRDWQAQLLRGTALPARERALAGDLLAHLGETRQHLLDVDYLHFSFVPRGPFWIGKDKRLDTNVYSVLRSSRERADGSEHAKLHCNEGVNYDYWIAQTAVTVAQFQQFLTSSDESRWLLWDAQNEPVIGVTWRDAQAFSSWLTERWQHRLPEGWRVMLPSEAEWEKAARGGVRIPVPAQVATAEQGFSLVTAELHNNPLPQREYPWGNEFVAINTNAERNVGSTSTPGCFQRGRSPYGCEDMAGNVWEWTRSRWGKRWDEPDFVYPYEPDDPKREDPDAGDDVVRVVRGGSWLDHRIFAGCAARSWHRPNVAHSFIGFRVVLRSAPVASPEL